MGLGAWVRGNNAPLPWGNNTDLRVPSGSIVSLRDGASSPTYRCTMWTIWTALNPHSGNNLAKYIYMQPCNNDRVKAKRLCPQGILAGSVVG